MRYPARIRAAIAEALPCKGCGHKPKAAHVISVEPYIAADRQDRSRMRCLIKSVCPCGRGTAYHLDLDRDELDAAIRGLRLRANRPPSRREEDQAYVVGPKVPPLGRVEPSTAGIPDTPITDAEVAAFEKEMSMMSFRANEIGFNVFLVEMFEAAARRRSRGGGDGDGDGRSEGG